MVEPHFTMLWSEEIPHRTFTDDQGRSVEVVVVAGKLGDAEGPRTPPNSWASRPESAFAIYTIKLDPGARWTLPPAEPGLNRVLYTFVGDDLKVDTLTADGPMLVQVASDRPVALGGGKSGGEILMLQARPIGEPVAQHGPFVMNTRAEIQQAFADYRSTGFGGWPWPSNDPVHEREEGRFAIHADGRKERPA
jgi:redox-sensitive bicupin YhaK (pirin superfamily)